MGGKLICLDIELTPRLVWVWSGRNYEVDVIDEEQPWYILCFAWQEYPGKTQVFSQRLSKGYRPGKLDDKEVIKKLRDILDGADTVLTHNGKKFDIKKFNSRCLYHGIKPPSDFKQVDTYQWFRSTFAEDSNKLQEIAKKYGLGSKIVHNGFSLWRACMNGDERAWKVMERYNKRDVDITVSVYKHIKEWIDREAVIYDSRIRCQRCGSPDTRRKGRETRATGKTYQAHQCSTCGHRFIGKQIVERI